MTRPDSDGAVAAVDCGTNSTRLLIASATGATLDRRMTITRLGAGVDRNHALARDAVERTAAVLRDYRAAMDLRGVGRIRMTATSAVRDASNRYLFFAAARDAVGVNAELIDGVEEATLSFTGATAELPAPGPGEGPRLVADIGGGSTELAVGPAPGGDRLQPIAVRSLDMGCVRVTERFLLDDPPTPHQLASARAWVAATLDEAVAAQPAFAQAGALVGLAGTVSAAASLHLRLARYDRSQVHHHRLPAAVVADLVESLGAMTVEQRRARPGMESERADVIVGGLIVLDGILTRFGLEDCLVSESDILDGLVMGLLG